MIDAYVYVIFRPDGHPCYVGKGKGNRWNNHRTRSTNPHLARIVAKAGGDLPKVKVRQGLTDEAAFAIERALIAAIGREANGGALVNMTDGGDGLLNPSEVTRAKMSASAVARCTPEWRDRISRQPKNHAPKSAETRARMRGKKSAEHCAALSAALRGKPKSASHVAKMVAAKTGMKNKPASQDRKSKVRAASFAYWERWRAGGIPAANARQKSKHETARTRALRKVGAALTQFVFLA